MKSFFWNHKAFANLPHVTQLFTLVHRRSVWYLWLCYSLAPKAPFTCLVALQRYRPRALTVSSALVHAYSFCFKRCLKPHLMRIENAGSRHFFVFLSLLRRVGENHSSWLHALLTALVSRLIFRANSFATFKKTLNWCLCRHHKYSVVQRWYPSLLGSWNCDTRHTAINSYRAPLILVRILKRLSAPLIQLTGRHPFSDTHVHAIAFLMQFLWWWWIPSLNLFLFFFVDHRWPPITSNNYFFGTLDKGINLKVILFTFIYFLKSI